MTETVEVFAPAGFVAWAVRENILMKSVVAIACGVWVASLPALGGAGTLYGQVGYQSVDATGYAAGELPESASRPGAAMLRAGYEFTPNFGVEVNLAAGVGDQTRQVVFSPENCNCAYIAIYPPPTLWGDLRLSLKRSTGLFLAARWPRGPVTLHTQIGLVSSRWEAASRTYDIAESESSSEAAFGIGAEISAGILDIRLDATRAGAGRDGIMTLSLAPGRRLR